MTWMCMCCMCEGGSVVSNSLWPPRTVATGLLCPRYSPGKNGGVGCHFLLQGDLPDPGIKPGSFTSLTLAAGSLPLAPTLSSNTLATWCEELTHWKRPWYWARLKAGKGDDRGWDGWIISPTQWTWVWANCRSLEKNSVVQLVDHRI